jgi:hypothetical protein
LSGLAGCLALHHRLLCPKIVKHVRLFGPLLYCIKPGRLHWLLSCCTLHNLLLLQCLNICVETSSSSKETILISSASQVTERQLMWDFLGKSDAIIC